MPGVVVRRAGGSLRIAHLGRYEGLRLCVLCGLNRLVCFLHGVIVALSRFFRISLDFSNLLVHRGGKSEKILCCNNFSWIQERPDADRVYAETVCI